MQASIQTPTSQLANSHHFYQQLNYTLVAEENNTYSDGQVIIEINPDRFARLGINFYQPNWSFFLESLPDNLPTVEQKDSVLLSDPNGVKIYLKTGELPDLRNDLPLATTGNFGGISIEVMDLSTSLSFWKLFGYEVTQGAIEKGWITLSNDTQLDISLMQIGNCPHLFFNPGLNYFNGGNNLSIIEKVRVAGIPIAEEITYFNKEGIVDNIILQDPGGLGFFIFSD